jgi:hypothetical protein
MLDRIEPTGEEARAGATGRSHPLAVAVTAVDGMAV